MNKDFIRCSPAGLIRVGDMPAEASEITLAKGYFNTLIEVVMDTAEPAVDKETQRGRWRVPGTRDDATPRDNLEAIANYMQALADKPRPFLEVLGA